MFGCLKHPHGRSDSRIAEKQDFDGHCDQALSAEDGTEMQAPEHAYALQTAQAHGFGDLPWHVLHVLMSHVVGHADVDTVRAARLVCRSWRDALSGHITAAILRPLTKQSLDIDLKNRPIVNHALEGLRAPTRLECIGLTEAVLESSYVVHSPDAASLTPINTVSANDAEAAQAEADTHWEHFKASSLFSGATAPVTGLPRANSLGHYPFEDSDIEAYDTDDSASSTSDLTEAGLHILHDCDSPEQLRDMARPRSARLRRSLPAGLGSATVLGRSGSGRRALMHLLGRPCSGPLGGHAEAGEIQRQAGEGHAASVEGCKSEDQVGTGDSSEMEKLARPTEGRACASAAGTAASCSSNAAAGVAGIRAMRPPAPLADDSSRYPLPRCAMLQRPTATPVMTRVRRQLIAPQHPPLRPALVTLQPLRAFSNLQTLVLRQAAYGLDAAALAAMTRLTNLGLRLERRKRLGITTPQLPFLPPPSSLEAVWEAVAGLPCLRRLDLSHCRGTVTPGHLAMLSSLTSLQSLDLTGVHLPTAALAPLQTLTSVTQLRIPNVKIVSESFMPVIGERRTAPLLAGLLDAMPQLWHLDLFSQCPGDNQTFMKDPKHMRTLGRATNLRRLDIAKIAQVSDRSLTLLSPLTAITALKLGCNAWDLYKLTGRAFTMFRQWRALRVLHVEACRNLDRSALIAITTTCPGLECLHLDTACRVSTSHFRLVTMMPALTVLELVELVQVPDAEVRDVCSRLPRLRPGMADHIIALKRCGGHSLGKFGEKVHGSFFKRALS